MATKWFLSIDLMKPDIVEIQLVSVVVVQVPVHVLPPQCKAITNDK